MKEFSDAELMDLLKGVSRSFVLTIRALPRGLRRPIGLAYLLARASDTSRIPQPPASRRARIAWTALLIRCCARGAIFLSA